MKRYTTAVYLTLLVLLLAACSAAPDQSASDSTPGDAAATQPAPAAQGFDLGELSYIFETPADVVNVGVVLDSEKTVEALIPVEGGSISATGTDGTVYTLDIPADALLNETMIGLTPVTSITGMPFGTQTYAVQLSPEGLFLQNFAILTIAPAEDLPIEEQIVFGYQEAGSDLILAAPVVDSNEIKIYVQHFSGNGVTKGLLADIEPVRKRLGGDAERRLQSALAEVIGKERQRQLLGGSEAGGEDLSAIFAEAFRQYVEQVIKPRVAAAGESCANAQLALQTVLGFERQRQLLGTGDSGGFLDGYPGLMDTAARVCVKEEYELCAEEHIIHRMLPVWFGFERQYQLLGMPDSGVLNQARELATKCLTFTLEFESTGTAVIEDGGYQSSSVTSEIILRFDPDALKISGEAELVNEEYELTWTNCSAETTTGGGTFSVYDLRFDSAPGASTEYDSGPEAFGHVKDFTLTYHPGTTTETASITCSNQSPWLYPVPVWSLSYFATHIDEFTEEGWVTVDWDLLGDELFAEKEWNLTSTEAGAEAHEEGSFELHHTPGS